MKIGDNILLKLHIRNKPIKGDTFKICAFTDEGFIIIKNVKGGHNGRAYTYYDEDMVEISNPLDGSEQYWFVLKNDILELNDIQNLFKQKENDNVNIYLKNRRLI